MKLLFIGTRFQGLSSEDKYNLVQLMTMSAVDFLDQWFETDVLKATMSASGIIGTFLGVRSPGTAYVLLHHYMGEIDGAFRAWGFARGGTGAISNAIADAAGEAGVEIRTEALRSQRSSSKMAARLELCWPIGDEIYADVVSSSVDPRHTFIEFIENANFSGEFLDEVRRYKFRGSSGKVNLALDGLPNFKCMPGPGAHLRGAMSISPASSTWNVPTMMPSTEFLAASVHRHGDSVAHRSERRASGQARDVVLRAVCALQAARRGCTGTTKRRFRRHSDRHDCRVRAEYQDIILHRQVVTPLDLEREFGLSEGNIFQGELSLEQLFFLRPVSGWAHSALPSRICICADRRRIRAAASWARRDGCRRWRF